MPELLIFCCTFSFLIGGVTKAVNEFALKNDLQPFGEDGKAVLSKNSTLNYSTKIVF